MDNIKIINKRSNRKENLQFEINDNYYKIFKPFYYINTCFGLRAYNIKNGLTYPITKWNTALGISMSVVMVISFCLILKWSQFPDTTSKTIYYIKYSLHLIVSLVLPILNVYFKNDRFDLLKKFQEVEKIKNPEVTKLLSTLGWIFLILVTSYYVAFIWIRWTTDVHWLWPRVFIISTAIVFEMKVLQVPLIMFYLASKLKTWKTMIKSYQVDEYDETNQRLKQLEENFKTILEAYSMTQKTCQVIVLMCFVVAFIEFLALEGLFLIWAGFERNKYAELSPMACLVYGWMIKIVAIEVILCVSCEIFYLEITCIRETVITMTCKGESHFHVVQSYENLKDFSKSICRTIDSRFTKLSACSVFTVDAALFLRFIATVATYTVVLLQFAF